MNSISPKLIRAYREAKFVVESANPITLLVGQCNQNLSALLKEQNVSTAAFITAFNPHRKALSHQENIVAQSALIKEVASLALKQINGFGQDIAEQWPKEVSTLILDISETQAEALADKYLQNAFIWIGSIDAFPTLRLRHPIALPTSDETQSWLSSLPVHLSNKANQLSSLDQAWIMSVSELEQAHWLDRDSWNLNKVWPLARPDGSSMGIGTELDRMFKLIAAGQSKIAPN